MNRLIVVVAVGLCGVVLPAQAAELPARYTTANFWTAAHDTPVSFTTDGAGGFVGYTTTGYAFTQRPVLNDAAIRLQKFTIDEAFFYVSDRGVIVAPTDLAAVSVYLSRVV